jgi:hypothetical protein
MPESNGYQYLEPRGGRFRQLFVKGFKFKADQLYRETIGEDARTAEQVAADFEVPLAAVLEAIDYSQKNQDLLQQELTEELALLREYDQRQKPLMPPGYQPES